MRKPKIYSTLKVQQEMLKDTYNEKKGVIYAWDEARWLYNKKYDNDEWFIYKGVALYCSDKTLLNLPLHFKKMNIQNLLRDLSDASYKLELNYDNSILELSNNKIHEMIILEDIKGNEHKIDKKFLDIVNLDPFTCHYYIPEVGKNGIVAVRDEDGFLLAGIMEVK